MAPPAPLKCLKRDCDWITPQCPNWDQMSRLMDVHIHMEHPGDTPAPSLQAAAGAGTGVKSEKLPRPTLEEEISESDWNFFTSKWRRYKRATKLSGQDVVDQLWACMSEGLERQCHDHGASADTTTEEQLLELMKAFALRGVNKLCNVVDYLNLKQEENESITKFISRVRGQALTCDFKVKCTKEGCSEVVSYADKLSSHIIVRGLYNLDIQEDILKLAATTEDDLDLKKITEPALLNKLGIMPSELFPVTANVKLVDRKRLQLIGGMLITISAVASDGSTKTSSHMCYIGEKIEKLFLSREACLKLKIIDENFPNSKLINEKSSNLFTFAAMQHVLPPPTSQQMMGTPGTQWKEIDTVVNILDKLSLQYFDHRNNFRGGKLI